jgi:hypothetical protein
MHGAGLLAFVILVGATTSACQEGVGPPAPPPPPNLTGRVLPKPPGIDDFAHRSFGHPLSLPDAEAVLRHTRVFEVGGMPPKRQVQAFNVVFEQAEAVGRFRSIVEYARSHGIALEIDPAHPFPVRTRSEQWLDRSLFAGVMGFRLDADRAQDNADRLPPAERPASLRPPLQN